MLMIQNDLIEIFHVGDRYSIADVKRMLQTVYNKNEINKKAKSTDLALLGVKTKRSIITKEGRRSEGIRIIGIN